jgi:hypothetical protein
MEVLQLSASKRRLSISSSISAKLLSRSVDNSQRSPGKLRLSRSCNITISNKQKSSLCSSSSSSSRCPGNLFLNSRCNMYSNLCNRMRGSSNLHFRRRTKPGNLYLKMRFVIVLL